LAPYFRPFRDRVVERPIRTDHHGKDVIEAKRRSLAPSSRSPDPLGRLVLRQFLQTAPDRARCNPGRHRDRRDPSITRGERLCRRDQTATPFIEKGATAENRSLMGSISITTTTYSTRIWLLTHI